MQAYVCNRCEKVITDKKLKKDMLTLKFCTEFLGQFNEMHLCDSCKKDFYKFIENEKESEGEENL